MNLREQLPSLLPLAIDWAEAEAHRGYACGVALNEAGLNIARSVGVQHPELIRIVAVDRLPFPENAQLRAAAVATDLLGPSATGLTLHYTVFLCKYDNRPELLAHECRHVAQYEEAGSIAAFLPTYLHQIVTVGYENAPLERDAREYERFAA